MTLTLTSAMQELHDLRNSMLWAYAMGHGCSIDGSHPRFVACRQRDSDLCAFIREHTPCA